MGNIICNPEEVASILKDKRIMHGFDSESNQIYSGLTYDGFTYDELAYKKWVPYKLLDGIEKPAAYKLASYLENAAIILLKSSYLESKERGDDLAASIYESSVFPLIRRTFVLGGLNDDNFADILNDYYYFLVGFTKADISAIGEDFPFKDVYFDVEADICRLFSEMMVAKYANHD